MGMEVLEGRVSLLVVFVGGRVVCVRMGMGAWLRVRLRAGVSIVRLVLRPPTGLLFASTHDHFDFGRADTTAINAIDFKGCTEIQRSDGRQKDLGRHSGVDECSQEHVAANAGEAVEVGDPAASVVRSLP